MERGHQCPDLELEKNKVSGKVHSFFKVLITRDAMLYQIGWNTSKVISRLT